MCGFLVTNEPKTDVQVSDYLRNLVHRGPDYQGYKVVNGWTFCFTRLAITDVSSEGNQPFFKDGKVLVFNGEIYNFKDLINRFGFHCSTSCDTEVLWNILDLFGLDGLRFIDGMYSFVYIDFNDLKVLVARDRFGQKPFFYKMNDGYIYFSSELNLIISPDKDNRADIEMFANYIMCGQVDNSDRTFFDGISQLLPGQSLEFSMSNNKINIANSGYLWDSPSLFQKDKCVDVTQEYFEEIVERSVANVFDCDVKSGICLSGGVDSSVLLALAKKQKRQLNIYTFEFSDYSELEYVRKSINSLGVSNILNVCTVDLGDEELLESIQSQVSYFCSPSGSLALVGMEEVYKRAKSDCVKVLFNGAGADELWMGYTNQLYLYLKELEHASKYHKELYSLSCFLGIDEEVLKNTISSLNSNNIRTQDGVDTGLSKLNESTSLMSNRVSFLRSEKLTRGCKWIDHLSMKHSIEVRLPYLSDVIFENLFPLEPSFCLNSGMTKSPLRKLHQKLYSNNDFKIPKMHKQHPQYEFMNSPSVRHFIDVGLKNMSTSDFWSNLEQKGLTHKLTSTVGSGSSLKAWITLNTIIMYELYFKSSH